MTYKPFQNISIDSVALVAIVALLFLYITTPYIPSLFNNTERTQSASVLESTVNTLEYATLDLSKSDTSISAQAVYVYDLKEGRVIYEKNAHAQLPLASLAKLMTAFVADNTLSGNATLSIPQKALDEEGDSGLIYNEKWNLEELLNFTLITSSNDGAEALAISAGKELPNNDERYTSFVSSMNNYAQTLGLTQTYFLNPTGLDVSTTQSGAYGSARDIAMLLSYILKTNPSLLEKTRYAVAITDSYNHEHSAENTNIIVSNIPGLIASKTGFTDLAGGNLAIVFDANIGHPIVIVLLGSTKDDRFVDMLSLVEKTRDFVNR